MVRKFFITIILLVYLNGLHASAPDLPVPTQCMSSLSSEQIEEFQHFSNNLELRLQLEQQPVHTGSILNVLGQTFNFITFLPKMIIGNTIDITISPLWGTLSKSNQEKIIADSIIERALQMKDIKKQLAPQFDECKAKNPQDLSACDETMEEIRQIALSIAKENRPNIMPLKNRSTIVKISKATFLSRIIELNLKKLNFPSDHLSAKETQVTTQATRQVLKDYDICIKKNQGDCSQRLSSSIFFRIGKETLSIMLEQNFKCLLPMQTLIDLKKWTMLSYDQCGIEYYFKNIDNKKTTANPLQITQACIMKSIKFASQKAIESTLEQKLNAYLGPLLDQNEIREIYQKHLKKYNHCLSEGGIKHTPDLDLDISQEQFKTTLVNCSNELTFETGQSIFGHSIKNHKDLNTYVSKNEKDQFLKKVMQDGFLPCMDAFHRQFPENCQGFTTSMATAMILETNLKKSLHHLRLPASREQTIVSGYHQCIDKHHQKMLVKARLDLTSYLLNPKCKKADSLTCVDANECPPPAQTSYDESVHVGCMQQTVVDQSFDLTGILIDHELKNNDLLKKYDFTLPPEFKQKLQRSTQECIRSLIACDQAYLLAYQHRQGPTCNKTISNLVEFQRNMPLVQTICENQVFKDAFLFITQHLLNIEIKKNIKNDRIPDVMAKIKMANSLSGEDDLLNEYQTTLQHEEKMLQLKQENFIQKIHQQLEQDLSTKNTKNKITALIPTLTASITLMVAQDSIDQVLESIYPINNEDRATTIKNQAFRNKVNSIFFNQAKQEKIKAAIVQNNGSAEIEILRLKQQLTGYLSEEVIQSSINKMLPFDQFGTQSQDVIMAAQTSFKACLKANDHNLDLCSNQETQKNTLIIFDHHLKHLTAKLAPKKQMASHLLEKVHSYFNFKLDSIKKIDPQKISTSKQMAVQNVQVCLNKLDPKENPRIFSKMTKACVTWGILDFYNDMSKNYIEKFQILHKKDKVKDIKQRQTSCQEEIKQDLIGKHYARYQSNLGEMIKRLSLGQLDLITTVQARLHKCQQILEQDLSKIDLPFRSD
ncbi:MAG: hypothetical protein A2381_11735 [Bdellovibrionales bacterium RIFOXYB1_FULL_37_110]|nr:MAG: hypothetical protein A2181_05570 [Bdellovibrionales bacterium RIFOXYA1_FULL_38_20]OFZ49226.1 MAG: hypothetical protein A2417_16975 [Bdellovibrionales bacterium RIFOXYC1_FULL_37_79]OFZ58474.1 MAG: hypothetical protein A2381_11735 [Bdellovibrionales bacterium RIFOXYB1_FULL_37_110]OFZ61487.1 MAG: hypothetical protein A2577_00255 [Bdellovibrionales bacterium RIFOXYD1_FULL_36_51]